MPGKTRPARSTPRDSPDAAFDVVAMLLLAGGMACFGSATPVSAIVGRSFPPWLASALRMAVAAAILVPALLITRRSHHEPPLQETVHALGRRDWLLLAGMAAIGTFGFSLLLLIGMRHAPGAVAAVVMATTPAVTAIGAVLFLSDRLDGPRVASVALAVAGVVVVNLGSDASSGGGDAVLLGSALVFGAVVCEAAYSLMGKRLTAELSPLALTTAAASLALLLFLPLAVWDASRLDWSKPAPGQWIAVAWWGGGTMALGSWLWFQGLARVPASQAAPFMGVMPVSALVLSYILLGEAFQWIHLAGMAIVLAGLALVVRSGASVH